MNENPDEQFRKIIKNAIEPIGERQLQKDLWRQARVKFPQPGITVSVFDWTLAALAVILSFLVPEAFISLLAHL
jgi:hypothetical protein